MLTKIYMIGLSLLSLFFVKSNEGKKISVSEGVVHEPLIIHSDEEIHPIGPNFWGTNLLFWIEDDEALANGTIEARLKEMNIKLLRYPGGTVADNFHWETNMLHNNNKFPFQEGGSKTDFDEFMAVCKRLNVQPSVVVNTESWAVDNDIPGGAHEAAKWLRYCKKKGYNVKIWEIGNETYWAGMLTAEEYGNLVNIYADSLKKIDPTIIIGVNGHSDINMVGTKERIKPGAYAKLMDLRRNINSQEDFVQYKKFRDEHKQLPNTKGNIKWWETLARTCGHNVDMIVVHWYFGPNQLKTMDKKLQEVRQVFADKFPTKEFMLNMSEYNTTQLHNFKNDEHLYLTEALGKMLMAKTDIASFWPMRMKNYDKLRLLDFETAQLSIIGKIHQHLSTYLDGALVRTSGCEQIPAYASSSQRHSTVVLTGRLINQPNQVSIKVDTDKGPYTSCHVWRIKGKGLDYQTEEENLPLHKEGLSIDLTINPLEVVVVTFER